MLKKALLAALAAAFLGVGAMAVSSPAEATFWKKDRVSTKDGRDGKLLWWKDKDRKHGWLHKDKKRYAEPAPAPAKTYRPLK